MASSSARRGKARGRVVLGLLLVLATSVWTAREASAQTLEERKGVCVACHGETGQSANPDIPSIGGQPKLFVMYQLFFYREGRRKNPEMNAIAKGISDSDLDALAEWVSKLPPPEIANDGVDGKRMRRGEAVSKGRQCGSCHNPDYSGREQMPRLAGQREAYLLRSFKEYQAGTRVGTQAAMAEAVRGLSEAELADLSYYLANFR
jgi:cytochrome c553